jgi:hypothetical protein
MKSLNHFATTALATLAASLTLVGCQMGSFPEASMNPEQSSLGTIQGSDYGGHAPLIGAHVYVLQPSVHQSGNSNTGNYGQQFNAYGYQATSLLSATYSNNGSNYPATIKNSSDPGIPTSWYYLKTDLTGGFTITGDYTCTVGLPVYLYLYGGSPQYPSANNAFSISNVVFSGSASPYTVTLTINTTGAQNIENAYTGEFLTIGGSIGVSGGGGFTDVGSAKISNLNATDQVVIAGSGSTGLTTTQFSFSYGGTLPTGVTTGTNYPQSGSNQVTFLPTFNPAVVNLAVLGNCPSSGTFAPGTGPSALNFVYVNEVSTVAAAYAFAPFTNSTSNGDPDGLNGANNAIYIGTSTTNVAGIQNAASIAAQLYDIQGGNLSTTYAGEGHIARPTTVNGNGIVPQATLDTLGNILAACVDSNNGATTVNTSGSYNGTTGAYSGISSQCNTLFQNATNTGIPTTSTGSGANAPGQQPYDIAQAAINIARHPAGPPYSYTGSTGTSAFVTALYNLPTGNVPFAPYLTVQPNDFTIGIDYVYGSGTNPYTRGPESLAIDKIGNVWVTGQPAGGANYYFFELSPTGIASNVQTQTSYIYGYVTIDSGESAWSGPAFTNDVISYVHATQPVPTAASGSAPVTYSYSAGGSNATLNTGYFHYASAADSTGNVYFGDEKTNKSGIDYIATLTGAATTPTVTATQSANALVNVNSQVSGFSHAAMAAYGYAYFDYNASNNAGTPTIDLVHLTDGTDYGNFPVTNATAGCTNLTDPEQMAVLRSADILQPDYHNQTGTVNGTGSSVFYITNNPTPVCTELTGASYKAGFNSPFGVAIDGNDYAYITNRGGATISVLNASGGTAASTVAVSPSTGYEPQYEVTGSNTLTNMLANPLNIVVGPSGEIWITDYGNGSLIEMVGLAAPATTPLSVAAITVSYSQGSIGYRP